MLQITLTSFAYAAVTNLARSAVAPPMDGVMVLGFLISLATVVCYLQHRRYPAYVPGLGVCLGGMAIYGFLQGSVALGIVAGLWAVATVQHWRRVRKGCFEMVTPASAASARVNVWSYESRVSRLFGSMSAPEGQDNDWIGGES